MPLEFDPFEYVSTLFEPEIPQPAEPANVLAPLTTNYIVDKFAPAKFFPPRVYQFLRAEDGRNPADVLESNEYFAADDTKFIVHNEANRRFYVFDSYADYKSWFAAGNIRTLHEVIRGSQPQKLKFDIDVAADKLDALDDFPEPKMPVEPEYYGFEDADAFSRDRYAAEMANYAKFMTWRANSSARTRKSRKLINTITTVICESFQQVYGEIIGSDHFAISDSTDATKFSRHLVINGFYVQNHNEAQAFTDRVLAFLPDNLRQFLDAGVNKKMQNFRLPGCHKVGSTRVKRCVSGSNDRLIISQIAATDECLPAFNVRVDKEYNPDDTDDARVIELAAEYSEGLKFHKRINNIFHYRRTESSFCRICDRVHDADHTFYATVSNGYVRARCRRSKHSICVGRVVCTDAQQGVQQAAQQFGDEIKPGNFKPGSKIPAEFSIEQYSEPNLRPFVFHGAKYDSLVIKSNMGTGKTKQLIELINRLPEEIGVIFVSFRRSFTTEIKNKLGGKFVDYREVKGDITAHRLIIQFESLHRLRVPLGSKHNILVLDESESIIGQMENRQMAAANTLRKCWEHFQWLVTMSTKVIAMDAFADFRTYSLMAKARKSVHMHLNTWMPTSENAPIDNYYENSESFLSAVYDAAARAKAEPFVFVSTAKNQSDAIAAKISKICPQAKISSYNSDSTELERQDFNDVNKAWADVDVLIYTSTVSAGCSFELPRFKRVFAFFSDRSSDYKTAIQMLGRIRNVESREYNIFIKASPSDLPCTVYEIERAMASRQEIGGIITNPLQMPKMINAKGDHEYSLKDLYYHLHIGNIVHRCQSKNYFRRLFQQHRAAMGARLLKKKVDMTDELADELKTENREAIKQIACDQNAKIAAAEPMTEEEAARIKNQEILTADQKSALTLHRLTETYGVPADAVTADFVAKYNKPKAKRIYKNLNRIGREESIAAAVRNWRELAAAQKTDASIDDLNDRDNLLQCMFAVDILNGLMSAEQEYCSEFKQFHLRYLARVVLEQKIDQILVGLRDHVEIVSLIFGIRRDRLMTARESLKSKLEIVNSILNGAFGVKITAVDRKATSDMFQLSEPNLFRWSTVGQKYVVAD